MARAARTIVQPTRLRDQVYDVIREEIKAGDLKPGERLLEAELAAKYKVSRTPVREALFQLSREGMLIAGGRGFTLPVESPMDFVHRLEVRILLDPELARHAATEGTDAQHAALSAVHERMKQAQKAGKFSAFAAYGHEFRLLLIAMCANPVLVKCCEMLENRYLAERNNLYKDADNREFAIENNERQVKAILERNADEAAKVAREYMEALLELLAKPALAGKPPQLPVARSQRAKSGSSQRKA